MEIPRSSGKKQETELPLERIDYERKMEFLSAELAEIIKPHETAIIVVDVMDAYFDSQATLPQLVDAGTTKLEETAQRISGFLDESRKYPVAATVFARMIERPDTVSDNYRYKMEKVDDTPPLVEVGGAGWNYHGVEPQGDDHEITKTHYNAFTGTDLHEYLKAKNIKTIVLIGGYGSRCVAATAIVGADVYGYHVVVPQGLIANLDSADNPNATGQEVDGAQAFLQDVDAVWGYTPSPEAILNTWEQQTNQ